MMSTILVKGLQCITHMEPTGIRRMSRDILSLHQNLCNVTQNPELALDRARLYYEMLHLSPQVLHAVNSLTFLSPSPTLSRNYFIRQYDIIPVKEAYCACVSVFTNFVEKRGCLIQH